MTEATRAPARPDAVLQRRGVRRMQSLLDAAERILEEDGYEAATLKAIGERAGIPTASVYHYFADRHQIDEALIRRHIDAMETRISVGLERAGRPDSLRGAVDAVIDPMLDHFRAHPSGVELWFGGRSQPLIDLVQEFDDRTADRLWELATQAALLRRDTPALVMRLAFESGSRLFDVAFRSLPGEGDEAVLDEARKLITAYLSTYAP